MADDPPREDDDEVFVSLLQQVALLDVDDVTWTAGDELCGGRLVIENVLGRGGMGIVFAATDRKTQTAVALKAARRLDDSMQSCILREFRILRDLEHPHIVRAHELHREAKRWCFTMDRLPGRALSDEIARPSTPQERWLSLRHAMSDIVSALIALHESGRVHCDVKPGNVVVRPNGHAVLLDLGTAHETDGRSQNRFHPAGTGVYAAPELIDGHPPTAACDWYSFGVLLNEAVTGIAPTEHDRLEQRHIQGVGDALSGLTRALLDPTPEHRPDGDAIRRRLSQIQSSRFMR